MPPNKGSSMKQRTLNFKSVKKTATSQKITKEAYRTVKRVNKLKLKIKKPKRTAAIAAAAAVESSNSDSSAGVGVKKPRGKAAQIAKLAKCDMHVNLKIPVAICKNLPSVKTDMKKGSVSKAAAVGEYRGMGVYKRHSVDLPDKEETDSENGHAAKTLLGAKKRRGEVIKYQLHLQLEEKFNGMIFDIAIAPSGDIVVTCTEEAVLCDASLKRKRSLERVMSPGGAGFLKSTGEILVVCRCSDNVNVFSASGLYKRSFMCGPSPCGLTVTERDEIIVTDTGAKLVRFYSPDGTLQRTIESSGADYLLRWPIYATTSCLAGDIIVSDCHQQRVLVFSQTGTFKSHFQLRTQGGNQVLRPHGVCANNEGDLFIIDTAIDSMEVFQNDGTFRQTLLPSDDGVLLKPKVIAISPDNSQLALGGMRGAVRLYKFIRVTEDAGIPSNGATTHQSGGKSSSRRELKREVKQEIKEEVIVLD